jgi:hypothetical protein
MYALSKNVYKLAAFRINVTNGPLKKRELFRL